MNRARAWRANYTPKLKKRTALLRKLKDVFRRYQSQPVDRVIALINPVGSPTDATGCIAVFITTD
jgi:RNA-directed DNA polymerase